MKVSRKILVVFILGLVFMALGAVGLYLFAPSGSVGIIGGADGPTAIFVTGPGAEWLSEELILGLLVWGPVVLLGGGAVLCLAAGLSLLAKRRK